MLMKHFPSIGVLLALILELFKCREFPEKFRRICQFFFYSSRLYVSDMRDPQATRHHRQINNHESEWKSCRDFGFLFSLFIGLYLLFLSLITRSDAPSATSRQSTKLICRRINDFSTGNHRGGNIQSDIFLLFNFFFLKHRTGSISINCVLRHQQPLVTRVQT